MDDHTADTQGLSTANILVYCICLRPQNFKDYETTSGGGKVYSCFICILGCTVLLRIYMYLNNPYIYIVDVQLGHRILECALEAVLLHVTCKGWS